KRKATRAAQKIPRDYEELLRHSFLRECRLIRDFVIPAVLRVNIDQTQVAMQDTGGATYHPMGAKQVAVHGVDEKRAFTILAGVAADGTLLPFQAIYKGYTKASLPTSKSPRWDEAEKLGFRFNWGGHTYWSTQETMQDYVMNIIVPHFARAKDDLKLDAAQECILQLDCWSVHRSDEFRAWMEATYPWIMLDYVPGGCT
ncbi:hypothetical protein EXIGLDRAFT_587471, partial [Exidia glandulosa HHB12029]